MNATYGEKDHAICVMHWQMRGIKHVLPLSCDRHCPVATYITWKPSGTHIINLTEHCSRHSARHDNHRYGSLKCGGSSD